MPNWVMTKVIAKDYDKFCEKINEVWMSEM